MTLRHNNGEVPPGHPKRLRLGALAAGSLLAFALLGVAVAGCGGGDASGAMVSVYAAAPLCAGARAELAEHGPRAGHFRVAIRCLAPSERAGGGVELAAVGSNSRRATEDVTTVAALESPGPGGRFSRPILESAHIPLVVSRSGRSGMGQILAAVESAGTSNVRESVRGALAMPSKIAVPTRPDRAAPPRSPGT